LENIIELLEHRHFESYNIGGGRERRNREVQLGHPFWGTASDILNKFQTIFEPVSLLILAMMTPDMWYSVNAFSSSTIHGLLHSKVKLFSTDDICDPTSMGVYHILRVGMH
jgi:hypothetical protein